MTDSKKTMSFSFSMTPDQDYENIIHAHLGGTMGVLPLRDSTFFPSNISTVLVGRAFSRKLVKEAEKKNKRIMMVAQKASDIETPAFEDLEHVGVVAQIVHCMELPDGNLNVLVQCLNRARITNAYWERNILMADVEDYDDEPADPKNNEYLSLLKMIKNRTLHFLKVSDIAPEEFYNFVRNLSLIPASVNFIAMNLPLDLPTKQQLLEAPSEQHRAVALLKIINTLIQLQEIKQSIENKTRAELDQQQKEYFLNQQIKNLQAELGGADETSSKQDDINKMRKEAEGKMWSDKVQEIFNKELMRLQRINIQSPDYNVQLNYLQTMLQLPWDYCTVDHLKLKSAEKILNQDHYGMEKVKERILEHLAVLQLRGDQKSPIICLYGPPGVGKTSLGKSIAKALKRKYVRMSLGGMHDESEIRGHRRTYIGAMPGRIVKNLIKAGSSNPVFVLDEIDKVSQATHNGDPSSALLEVLDPEQNTAFHDNFLDIDYDLSRVMFIATANDINTIPRPLLDRMELIEVGGYITEEKIEIAKRHLVPKEKEKNGLEGFKDLKLNKSAIEYIIEHYTRESGVRSLEKQINKVFRKMALEMARTEEEPQMTVTTEMVMQMLGKPLFNRDKYQGNEYAGVVTGLAWTSVGGEILYIETSVSRGKSGKLTLTGNLGDVMKESAMLALEYIKAHADK
ncbi:MAG: endopeptidase La, partial [Bacteroidaceae bacterium]|nr:endopeptidase La [Bacteroidaceae bacterium]